MNESNVSLPVPVLAYPHWRVNFRPQDYIEEAIPSLSECFRIVEKNCVRLRGWEYPLLNPYRDQRGQGKNWVASWAHFGGHIEYWRLYQSGQFLHLFSVRESTEEGWREKLEAAAKWHLIFDREKDFKKVPGFISLVNFIYCITEIVEFLARLSQAGIYKGPVSLDIHLRKINGFVLTTEIERAWTRYCAANQDVLGSTWTVSTEELIQDSAGQALALVMWFFERFGWMDPSREVIRRHIDDFLKGRG